MTKVLLIQDWERTKYDNQEHIRVVLMTGIACVQCTNAKWTSRVSPVVH